MAVTGKKDFTKEIKAAYRYSVEGDPSLLLNLILEITIGNRGKLFVLRDKQGVSIYSYYISPSAFGRGDVRDSELLDKTLQLGVSETKVAQTIMNKIQEYGLPNISACVIIENLARASFDYLRPLVNALFTSWPEEWRQDLFGQLHEILHGDAQLVTVIAGIKRELKNQLPFLMQLYRDMYAETLVESDITDDALTNIARALIGFIEAQYGADV